MYYSAFRAKNYKSFIDSNEIILKSGINILVGQNDSGKTALLETLSLSFNNQPHRSIHTIKRRGISSVPKSDVTFKIILSGQELKDILILNPHSGSIQLPQHTMINGKDDADIYLKHLFAEKKLEYQFSKSGGAEISFMGADPASKISAMHSPYRSIGRFLHYSVAAGDENIKFVSVADNPHNTYIEILKDYITKNIYAFRAERLNVSEYNFGTQTELESDARNLAQVLINLRSKWDQFRKYLDLVKEVFPRITDIVSRSKSTDRVGVEVWYEDNGADRDDLAIPLSNVGTGIGQVLAILYAVLDTHKPKIFIIDEPNSFLHPDASRKLMRIFERFNQHQFIISTHSPEVIAAVDSSSLLTVRSQHSQSKVESSSEKNIENIKAILSEIGVRISDVFGYDRVLWVEGRTEEIIFPQIIKKCLNYDLGNCAIVSVRNTGDFQSKHKVAVFEIYKNLTQSKMLIPPSLGFIFDREEKTDLEIDDLLKQTGGKMQFINERTFENNLLNPPAIAAIITADPAFQGSQINIEIIEQWILKNGNKKKYSASKAEIFSSDWIKDVHGAELLEDLFDELSEQKCEYRKTKHSVELCQWLIQNNPDALKSIASRLGEIFK